MTTATQKTLLVVDDDAWIRRAIVRALHDEPYRTLTVDSGPKALEVLAREEVHVILSDHHMPEMDGLTLLEEVAKRHPAVVRIMLTSDEDARLFTNAVNDAHVRRFLHKPWNDDHLRGALRIVMRTVPVARIAPAPRTASVHRFFVRLGIKD